MFKMPLTEPKNEETLLMEKEQALMKTITEYQHRNWLQNEIPKLRAELVNVRTRLEEVQFQRAINESRTSSVVPKEKKDPAPINDFELSALQHRKQSLINEIENYDYLIKQEETTAAQRETLTAFRTESIKSLKQIETAIQNNPQTRTKSPLPPSFEKAQRQLTIAKRAKSCERKEELHTELETLQAKRRSMIAEIANYDFLISQAETTPTERKTMHAFRAETAELLKVIEDLIQKNMQVPAKVAPLMITHPPVSFREEKADPLNLFDYIPRNRAVRATPILTFTDEETTLIQQYIKEGQDLEDTVTRPLIEATIMSNTMLELTFAPYSLIPEGWTDYSLQYLEDHFKLARKTGNIFKDQNNKAHPPFVKTPNLDFPCTEDDIIPCNTLLIASGLLLEKAKRWKKGDTSEPQVPTLKTYAPAQRRKYTSSTGLSATDVVILEKIYQSLPPSRQLMFNCILRDETDQIIESAVQLPDGYVYDESVPKKLLKLVSAHPPAGEFSAIHVYEGQCPRNPNITFKLVNGVKNGIEQEIYSEIKPVLYFGRVVSLLKEHAAKFVARFKEQQAIENAGAIPASSDDENRLKLS